MRWNDGRRSFTTHVNTNLRTRSTNSKMNPAKLVVPTVQPALVNWGKVLTRFRDGAGLELTFKAKLVPEWGGVGSMEQSHALAILGACGTLDTTEMKALDDQATAGSNTKNVLELCRVTEVRAKRAPLLTLANLARRVSVLLGEDVPAVTLQGAVCKFMQVLSCFACGKPFSRDREEDSNQKWHVSSLGRKLLRLMRKFQQSSATATKCCGDGKVH